jgi:hypothetical protein
VEVICRFGWLGMGIWRRNIEYEERWSNVDSK